MKVLIADKFEKVGIDGLRGLGCDVHPRPDLGAEGIPGALAELNPEILVVRGTKVPRTTIEAGKGLRLIIRAGAGFDNIDCKAAAARSVAVCNCPGMNAVAVAELAFGLLLCLDRRIVEQSIDLREGRWNKKEYTKARGLKGLTLGVIGVGAIGREVIRRAKAFGMHVWANAIHMTYDRAMDLGVNYGGSTRDELLAMLPHCDALTVHVAANPESERMCNAEFFAACKPATYFINTSRGSVVDEAALADAIKTKGLRVAADVFDNEPTGPTAQWTWPLATTPGAAVTHHIGASTDQAQNAVAEEVVRIVKVFVKSGRCENRVN